MRAYRDQADMRLHNTTMLLRMLVERGPLSRADLAKASKMSATSITRIISTLLDAGLIKETDFSIGGLGRRAIMLDIVPEGLYTVGIHLEKYQIKLCLLNFSAELVDVVSCEYDCVEKPVEDIARVCLELFHRVILSHHVDLERVIGIGVGVVGVVSRNDGEVILSPQLGWHNVSVKPLFEKVFGRRVTLDNDVKMQLIGRKRLLHLADDEDTAILQLGSGVGCAATSGGTLIRGKQNAAGELGHIIVDRRDGMKCECGRSGCLQTHIAIGHLLTRAQKHDPGISSLQRLRAAYDARAPWAVELMEDCMDHVGLALEMISNSYNPSKILITGALTRAFPELLPDVISEYQGAVLLPQIADCSVRVVNAPDDHACVLGCASMAREAFLPGYLLQMIRASKQEAGAEVDFERIVI